MKKITSLIFLFVICFTFLNLCSSPNNKNGSQDLKKWQIETAKIQKELQTQLDVEKNPVRLSIYKGLNWCMNFTKESVFFEYIYTDYIQMLHELTLPNYASKKNKSRNTGPLHDWAKRLIQINIQRSKDSLKSIFSSSRDSKWDFISFIPFILLYEKDHTIFLKFYKKHFPADFKPPYKKSFATAIKTANFDLLCDYVIDASYVHYIHKLKIKHNFSLPKNKFLRYLKRTEKVKWMHKFDKDKDGYHDQNYFITHLVYVKSNYGNFNNLDGKYVKRMKEYLKKNFKIVRHEVSDLDLLAEFIDCLLLLGEPATGELEEAIKYLISRQFADGSWGPRVKHGMEKKEIGLDDSPYDIFHPTWTVMSALNTASL
jgi:hypothetical protein